VAGTARPSVKGGEPAPEGATPEQAAAVEGAAGEPAGKAVPGTITGIAAKQDGTGGEHSPSSEGGFAVLQASTESSAREAAGPNARPSFADLLGPVAAPDAKPAAAAQRTVLTDVAIGRVPIEIGLRSLEGSNQFEIRLSPDELGRVDVKLDIDKSGEVRAHLVVERPEALALLTRDRAQLERAFEQAGLRPGDGGIAFSLRDGNAGDGGRSMQDGNRQGQAERGPAGPGRDEIAGARVPGRSCHEPSCRASARST
jgi:flagellar hook-length control protein FliK